MDACKTCFENAEKYFPGHTMQEKSRLLWGATAYPMGCGEHVEQQLKTMSEAVGNDIDKALSWAEQEMSRVWEETRPQREKWDREEGASP